MNYKKKIQNNSYESNKNQIIGLGLLLFVLLALSVLTRYHLKSTHKLKIKSLENIRLRLVYAHLEREDSTLTTFKLNHVFDANPKESLNTLLEVKWDDFIIPLLSNNELKELKVVIEKIQRFEKLIKQSASSQEKPVHDALFNAIIGDINALHLKLNNRLNRQNNIVFVIQIILIVILVAWLVFSIITLRNIRLDRKKILSVQHKLLEKLKRNNFFLEKTQTLSNLGYYTYNIHTNEFTASNFILDLVKDSTGDNILRKWKNIVHPDDRDILPNIFYKNKYADDFSFDITYRVISTTSGETRWIHHVASKLEEENKKEGITVIGVIQDITDKYNLELTIKDIEKSIALKMGKDYYTTLAKELNKTLKADYIIIGKYNDEKTTTTSVAHIDKLKTLPNLTYNITNTPCEIVLKEGYAFYGNNVAKYFDKDHYLKNLGISSYVGVAVYNKLNQVVGHLVALYCKPILEEEHYKLLMKIFADKIGTEFNRNKLLDNLTKNQEELLRSQELALLGTYTYDIKKNKIERSYILHKVAGFEQKALNKISDWHSVIHPDDLENSKNLVAQALKKGGDFAQEYRIITKDTKELKWIRSTGNVIQKDGVSVKIIGAMQDITQQKLIAIDLEQSHHKFKSLFQQNPIALWEEDYSKVIQLLRGKKQKDLKTYLDKNSEFVLKCVNAGKILNVNKAALDLFEVTDKEDLSNHLNTNFDKNVTAVYKEGLLALSSNKKTFSKKINFVTKYAKTINIFLKVVMVDARGDSGKIIFTAIDITEEKKALKNLKEAHDITGLGTFVFKAGGAFETSKLFNEIMGIDESYIKDLEGRLRFVYPDDLNLIRGDLNDNSLSQFSKEFRAIRQKDKKIIWLLGHVKKEFDTHGNLVKITGTIQDITQRKLIEEKIRRSDAILSKIDSLVLVNDGSSNMIYASPSVKKILGYEPEELLGQGWWNKTYATAAEAKKVQEAVTNYLYQNGPKTERVTYRKIKTKAGGFKHIEWHISKGVGKTYINIGIDITQRYREEQIKKIIFDISKYAHSNPKLEDLLPFIKDSLNTVIDTSNFYVPLFNSVNKTFTIKYISGLQASSLQDKTFAMAKTLTGYVYKKGKTVFITNNEFEALAKKGAVKLLGKSAKVWLGIPLVAESQIIGLLSIQSFNDENAYSQKDVALLELVAVSISGVIKRSQDYEKIRLLNQALIQSPEAVIVTNTQGEIEYVNPAFTTLSGYSEQEALGENPRMLKSGDQSVDFYKSLWDTITIGKIWSGEFINKHKDGSKYLVAATISAVRNREGVITHFIGVEENITEKRQLERDYIHAFIEAQEEEKVNFGEELHDGISQILAAEAMYIEILIRQNKDRLDGKAKYLYKVKELNLSAIEDARNISHGLMSKQLKERGLIIAVEHICDNFSKSKNIDFIFTCKKLVEDDISKEIKTNLYRVTQEISTNIVRHAAAKKAIISFEKTGENKLKLIIKDDGIGIDLDKIKKEKKGAGLKNIERRIILLSGKINIESQPNKGTCYTIEVPLERI